MDVRYKGKFIAKFDDENIKIEDVEEEDSGSVGGTD